MSIISTILDQKVYELLKEAPNSFSIKEDDQTLIFLVAIIENPSPKTVKIINRIDEDLAELKKSQEDGYSLPPRYYRSPKK